MENHILDPKKFGIVVSDDGRYLFDGDHRIEYNGSLFLGDPRLYVTDQIRENLGYLELMEERLSDSEKRVSVNGEIERELTRVLGYMPYQFREKLESFSIVFAKMFGQIVCPLVTLRTFKSRMQGNILKFSDGSTTFTEVSDFFSYGQEFFSKMKSTMDDREKMVISGLEFCVELSDELRRRAERESLNLGKLADGCLEFYSKSYPESARQYRESLTKL